MLRLPLLLLLVGVLSLQTLAANKAALQEFCRDLRTACASHCHRTSSHVELDLAHFVCSPAGNTTFRFGCACADSASDADSRRVHVQTTEFLSNLVLPDKSDHERANVLSKWIAGLRGPKPPTSGDSLVGGVAGTGGEWTFCDSFKQTCASECGQDGKKASVQSQRCEVLSSGWRWFGRYGLSCVCGSQERNMDVLRVMGRRAVDALPDPALDSRPAFRLRDVVPKAAPQAAVAPPSIPGPTLREERKRGPSQVYMSSVSSTPTSSASTGTISTTASSSTLTTTSGSSTSGSVASSGVTSSSTTSSGTSSSSSVSGSTATSTTSSVSSSSAAVSGSTATSTTSSETSSSLSVSGSTATSTTTSSVSSSETSTTGSSSSITSSATSTTTSSSSSVLSSAASTTGSSSSITSSGLSSTSSSTTTSSSGSSTSVSTTTASTTTTSTSATSSSSTSSPSGSATIFSPSACPAATPTGTYLNTGTSGGGYVYAVYGDSDTGASTQLEVYDPSGGTYLYTISSESDIIVVLPDSSAFDYYSDGSFVYYAAGCAWAFEGVYEPSSTPATRSTPPRQISLQPTFEVVLQLYNQCGQIYDGLSPHLLCYTPTTLYGSENPSAAAPASDFFALGEGVYDGSCFATSASSYACNAVNQLCNNKWYAAPSNAVQSLFCAGVAGLSDFAAAIATEGWAVPAEAEIYTAVDSGCSKAITFPVNAFCQYEYPSGTQCFADVYPVLELANLDLEAVPYGYGTTQILATVTVESTVPATVTATATAYAPICTITGHPLPTVPILQCPDGSHRAIIGITECEACYTTGLPDDDGFAYNICCDLCCGCCFPCGTGPPNLNDYPMTTSTDYNTLCCMPHNFGLLTLCGDGFDSCSVELVAPDSCVPLTPQEACLSAGGGTVRRVTTLCRDPNEYFLYEQIAPGEGGDCIVGLI